jgi:hypothetical protein
MEEPMTTVSTLNTLFAGCAVCAANSVEGGWYALAAIVFGLGASMTGLLIWKDSRSRGV